jgi:alkanesulfonate monooxygenase SsuD/methylene tetrahydromethanopterin reductase-like flavin-dependent oxidoreductase (luciferase family)
MVLTSLQDSQRGWGEGCGMDFGIFDHVERSGPDLGRVYNDRLAVAEVADEVGFYCFHVAEHQGTPLSVAPSPNLLLTAIAQRTKRIKVGALCYILPLYDPMRLINEICMLDHLSDGRAQVGIGRGVSPIEMGFFNIESKETRAIFNEDLEIILKGLTSKSMTHHGAHHDYSDVPIELGPRQQPYPPIWYPTSGLDSVPWVAKQRYQTVFLGAPAHIADQVRAYQDNLADPEDFSRMKVGMLRYVFVAETDEEAKRHAGRTYAAHLANLHYLAKMRGTKMRAAVPDTVGARDGNPEDIEGAVAKGWAAVGSPATVAEQIQAMFDQTGCNYLLFNPLLADTEGARGVASVQIFGEQVMPHFASPV